jgi:hypothetical protein
MNRPRTCQAFARAPTRRFAAWIRPAIAIALLGVAACAPVRAYERDVLARPEMNPPTGLGARFVRHVMAVRTAAEGGDGSVGGGCGCN